MIAAATTAGFVAAEGAAKDGLLVLLFGGFWIGIHAFLGFVRMSCRHDRIAGLRLLSFEDYVRMRSDKKIPVVDGEWSVLLVPLGSGEHLELIACEIASIIPLNNGNQAIA